MPIDPHSIPETGAAANAAALPPRRKFALPVPRAAFKRYEHHLSALAMVGGFGLDNVSFGSIDHPFTQLVLASYVLTAGTAIALLHFYESRAEREGTVFRWRSLFSATIQFALGGLWSAFLIFYSRGAVLSASWPFLLVLGGIFLGNEILRAYHSRLVFTALLFFFALFSYAVFVVPVLTGTIGTGSFLLGGALAVVVFILFVGLLARLGATRFLQGWRRIVLGACVIFVGLDGLYFLGVLPPLPLALTNAGIFHSVQRDANIYRAQSEPQPWYVRFGGRAVIHITPGAPISFYSAVFAPVRLTTRIVHRWQRYDDRRGWVTLSSVAFPITGGRGLGYRGYTIKSQPQAGLWRVDVVTIDGRIIGRNEFYVRNAASPPPQIPLILE
jgi:hypothetical protein